MPTRKLQVKQETRVDKIVNRKINGRSNGKKSTEPSVRGRTKDVGDASQVPNPSDGQPRRESTSGKSARKYPMNDGGNPVQYVPVVGKSGKPLMPCLPARARELMQKGKAVGKWKVGIFYLKLTERDCLPRWNRGV